MSDKIKVCKNAAGDAAHEKRPAIYAGPRCATCHRAEKKRRAGEAHAASVSRRFGIGRDGYAKLYAAQGGVCAICGPRTGRNGRTKRLAVDHDHVTGEVRGLLCGPCNRIIGIMRDDAETFQRAADYLRQPPARGVPDLGAGPL